MDTAIKAPAVSVRRQVGTFVLHFLEMCIAMCVGVAVANVLLRAVDGAGFDVRESFPLPSLLAIAVVITLPMAGWMRFRGMPWRPVLEMSAVGIVVVMVVAWLGLVRADAVTAGTACGIACLGMLGAMFYRIDLYTGRTGHHHG